jgi:diaminohydroxyphosphoribosylaminopyrimidine deaminase / 5-amino-6-(5-phosphoribosylamino)uracil reductase
MASSRAPAPTAAELAFLERAVELGRRGWGRVHPNPMVGCVLVRDGRVLGEGWHRGWGGPHAEVQALASAREAGHDPTGATAVVSLEPCNHHGKTPPCTLALRSAGVARVVYGAADPGVTRDDGDRGAALQMVPSGGGGAALAAAGVDVVGPVFSPERARSENPAFFHAFGPRANRPWLCLKMAVSADGFIAARPGARTAISGADASRRVQRLRAGFDAILVGGHTAVVDDPLLTVRGDVVPRVPPLRVVLDAERALPPTARLFREGDGEVIVFEGPEGDHGRGEAEPAATEPSTPADGGRGAAAQGPVVVRREVLPLIEGSLEAGTPRFDLHGVLRQLRQLGVDSVLCEGGGTLAAGLLKAGLVDRFVLIESERSLGDGGVPAFPGVNSNRLPWWDGDAGAGSVAGHRSNPRSERWVPVEGPIELGTDTWRSWDRERG